MQQLIVLALLFSAPCFALDTPDTEQNPHQYWKALCTLEMNDNEQTLVNAAGFGTTRDKAVANATAKLREHCQGFLELRACGEIQCETRMPDRH